MNLNLTMQRMTLKCPTRAISLLGAPALATDDGGVNAMSAGFRQESLDPSAQLTTARDFLCTNAALKMSQYRSLAGSTSNHALIAGSQTSRMCFPLSFAGLHSHQSQDARPS